MACRFACYNSWSWSWPFTGCLPFIKRRNGPDNLIEKEEVHKGRTSGEGGRRVNPLSLSLSLPRCGDFLPPTLWPLEATPFTSTIAARKVAKDSLSFSYPTTITYVYKSSTRIHGSRQNETARTNDSLPRWILLIAAFALLSFLLLLCRPAEVTTFSPAGPFYPGTMGRQREIVSCLLVRLPMDYSALTIGRDVWFYFCAWSKRIMMFRLLVSRLAQLIEIIKKSYWK